MQSNEMMDLSNFVKLTIHKFYEQKGISCSAEGGNDNTDTCTYLEFFIHRKHIIQYMVVKERYDYSGQVLLGFGPRYILPEDFWSYEEGCNFSGDLTKEAIYKNLENLETYFKLLNP